MGLLDGMGGGGGGILGGVGDMFHGVTGMFFGDHNTAPQMGPAPGAGQPAWPGAPVPQGVYNVGSYPGFSGSLAGPGLMEQFGAGALQNPSMMGPGAGQKYWENVQKYGAPGGAPQGSNLATQAYNQFQGQVPANMNPYYQRAMDRGTSRLGQQYSAMGMGGSSPAMMAQSDLISGLLADQAKAEAGYGLERAGMAGNLARGGDTSSQQNAQNTLGWTMGLGGLANNAQQNQLAQMMGLGSIANQAQNQLTGRSRGYFDDLMGLAGAQSGAMTGITMPMLQTQLGLMDQAMQAYLGYPRQMLNQGASDRASATQGMAGLVGMGAASANAGGMGAILAAL